MAILIFITILGAVFYFSYRLAHKTNNQADQQLIDYSRQEGEPTQQIRKMRFTNQETGEVMEIYMDGTVKYFDKFGNLIKTGRRGFAETQNIFKRYEWLINNNKSIDGGKYIIEIETQTGTTTYNPDGSGSGSDVVDDTIDFIDDTLNPTPTPTSTPNPSTAPTSTSSPTPRPSPTPLPEKPDYLSAPPFTCEDYYKSGTKPLKISNIYCGIE